MTPVQTCIEEAWDGAVTAALARPAHSPRMVTRPLIASMASITRPSWRNAVGSMHWLKHAKRTIISAWRLLLYRLGWKSLVYTGLNRPASLRHTIPWSYSSPVWRRYWLI